MRRELIEEILRDIGLEKLEDENDNYVSKEKNN